MNQEKLNELALDTLNLSRDILVIDLRFLDVALSCLQPIKVEKLTLLTDGKHIIYNPIFVLKRYKTAKEIIIRDYLHVVLHCIYQHMFVSPSVNQLLWDLACDIAVENTINDINIETTAVTKANMEKDVINYLKNNINYITAENIYVFLENANLDKEAICNWNGIFQSDNHDLWYMSQQSATTYLGMESNNSDNKNINQDETQIDYGVFNNNDQNVGVDSEMKSEWQKISHRVQICMESLEKQQGIAGGALCQNLLEVNREKYDYSSFLKKFAVMNEAMKINDDEFDYIFYTYGLKLYDRIPLIEPLEYKEIKAIKEFAIVIDTSGSVSGELVQMFMQKTYNILKSTESFFTKINVHLIQCDSEVQDDKIITSQKDIEDYIKNMRLKGFGGTDFCPAFKYIDQLCKKKQFKHLKGMLYFTDGYGIFPQKKPNYEVAFVFIDNNYYYNNYEIPSWAIKIILKTNDIQ